MEGMDRLPSCALHICLSTTDFDKGSWCARLDTEVDHDRVRVAVDDVAVGLVPVLALVPLLHHAPKKAPRTRHAASQWWRHACQLAQTQTLFTAAWCYRKQQEMRKALAATEHPLEEMLALHAPFFSGSQRCAGSLAASCGVGKGVPDSYCSATMHRSTVGIPEAPYEEGEVRTWCGLSCCGRKQ